MLLHVASLDSRPSAWRTARASQQPPTHHLIQITPNMHTNIHKNKNAVRGDALPPRHALQALRHEAGHGRAVRCVALFLGNALGACLHHRPPSSVV